MRITLEIDDDVFFVAHRLARRSGGCIGRELSNLARRGLETQDARGLAASVDHQWSTADRRIIEEAEQRAHQMLQDAQMAANAMLMEYQAEAQRIWDEVNERIQAAAQHLQLQAQESASSDVIGE